MLGSHGGILHFNSLACNGQSCCFPCKEQITLLNKKIINNNNINNNTQAQQLGHF